MDGKCTLTGKTVTLTDTKGQQQQVPTAICPNLVGVDQLQDHHRIISAEHDQHLVAPVAVEVAAGKRLGRPAHGPGVRHGASQPRSSSRL